MKVDEDSARVGFPPPLVFLGTLLLGLAAERLTGPLTLGLGRMPAILLGAALFAAGFALDLLAMGRFRRAETRPEPWQPSTRIVTAGIYGRTRNPMYLGMALIYAGLAILFDGPIALLLLPAVLAVIRTKVIAREESYLEAKFGEEYRSYKRRVRRWL